MTVRATTHVRCQWEHHTHPMQRAANTTAYVCQEGTLPAPNRCAGTGYWPLRRCPAANRMVQEKITFKS